MTQLFVLDRKSKEVIYEPETLPQAQGFSDASDEPCIIATAIESRCAIEELYCIAVIHESTGQIIMQGPITHIWEAAEELCSLRLALLPVSMIERGWQS